MGLIVGARLVVDSAITLAQMFGVSEFIIGITAVAIGTSLPELSTSIVAAMRKEQDIIVGNIIGSNIFNIGILGLVSVIQPISVNPALLKFEFPVMLFFTVLLYPLMRTGFKVSKIKGLLLLALYGVLYFSSLTLSGFKLDPCFASVPVFSVISFISATLIF